MAVAEWQWLRLYDDVLDDPKVQRLPPALFKYWINILCLANRGTPRGALPPIADIAFALRIDDVTAEKLMAELRKRELIEDVDGVAYPHNWNTRQFKSDNSTARVSAWRKANKKETVPETLHGEGNVDETSPPSDDETLHETPPEQIQSRTETEQNRADLPPQPPSGGDAETPSRRRSRIPDDWALTPDLRQYAADAGVPADEVDAFAEEFKLFWLGDGRVKADWNRTFQGRCRDRGPVMRAQAEARASPRASPNGATASYAELGQRVEQMRRQRQGP